MIKKYLFEVNKNEKSRILKLHSNINEQAQNQQLVLNLDGKDIQVSKLTYDFYNNAIKGDKNGIYNTIITQIKIPQDLNLLNDELTNKLQKSMVTLLDNVFKSALASRRVESNNIMKKIQSYLINFADISWDEIDGNYGRGASGANLKLIIKNPNKKFDTQEPEQKKNDNIAQKNQRFDNIKKSYCSVKNGKLMVGTQGEQTWDWYVKTYSVTPEEIKGAKAFCPQSELATKSASAARKKVTFVPNKKFPLRFGEKGNKISELQTALGIKPPTGNFYTKTEQFVNNKMRKLGLTYSRNKGVDATTFNSIISGKVTPKDTGYEDWYGEFKKQ